MAQVFLKDAYAKRGNIQVDEVEKGESKEKVAEQIEPKVSDAIDLRKSMTAQKCQQPDRRRGEPDPETDKLAANMPERQREAGKGHLAYHITGETDERHEGQAPLAPENIFRRCHGC